MAREEAQELLQRSGDIFIGVTVLTDPDGAAAIVSKKWMNANRISPPAVTPRGNGWEIHRAGVWVTSEQPVNITEFVGPDGSYTRSLTKLKLPQPSRLGWNYGYADD